ncbi:uncharacterized protein LOC128882974 [Hylaeus volcanicus]|uniref:uncharacterized protein LOC128882974 n=1 Tax=Hylaeus volcanicus TaxID=313075 RepID=UPI0023B81D3E|nr:uncharacterized protein LOC128882974 [Hylaeus volcanicus]
MSFEDYFSVFTSIENMLHNVTETSKESYTQSKTNDTEKTLNKVNYRSESNHKDCESATLISNNSQQKSTLMCDHCQESKNRSSNALALMRFVMNSCTHFENFIHHCFQCDTCICYPNYIDGNESLQDLCKPIILPKSFYTSFLEHLLRLVRPNNVEFRNFQVHSRVIRDMGNNCKVLIPVMINCQTNCVIKLGYMACYQENISTALDSKDKTCCKKTLSQFDETSETNSSLCSPDTYRILEIVIDYDPPQTLTPLPYKSRVSQKKNRQEPPTFLKPLSSSPIVKTKGDSTTPTVYQNHLHDIKNSITLETMTCFQMFQTMPHQDSDHGMAGNTVCINPAYTTQQCCEHISPIVSTRSENKSFFLHPLCSSYSCRGRRNQMEDRVLILKDLNTFCHLPSFPYHEKVHFFAIYDGHGGIEVVDYVSRHFHHVLAHSEYYLNGDFPNALKDAFQKVESALCNQLKFILEAQKKYYCLLETLQAAKIPFLSITNLCHDVLLTEDPDVDVHVSSSQHEYSLSSPFEESQTAWIDLSLSSKDLLQRHFYEYESKTKALENLCHEYDLKTNLIHSSQVSHFHNKSKLTSGSTASIVLLKNRTLYVANLGDSRCILSRGGRVACLTEDHRLTCCERELTRVRSTEGTFILDGYLCGQLAVSKAFGNLEKASYQKLLGLDAHPDIMTFDLREDDEFLLMACDGFFDSVTPVEAVSFLRQCLQQTKDVEHSLKSLVDLALEKSDDNVTVILIAFMEGITKEKQVTFKSTTYNDFHEKQGTTRKEISLSPLTPSTSHSAMTTSNLRTKIDDSFHSSCCTKCHCKDTLQSTTRNHSTVNNKNHDSKTAYIKKRYHWSIVDSI